jgi:hypothetical protein
VKLTKYNCSSVENVNHAMKRRNNIMNFLRQDALKSDDNLERCANIPMERSPKCKSTNGGQRLRKCRWSHRSRKCKWCVFNGKRREIHGFIQVKDKQTEI